MAFAPPAEDQEIKKIEVKGPEPPKVGMSISGGPFGAIHSPIHESLTLSALSTVVDSGVPSTVTESSANDPQWEYIRGVIWNDDPACELFWKSSWFDNHTHSGGLAWFERYNEGEKQWNPSNLSGDRFQNIIGRSHYGDMQWLHAMGAVAGENPHETKRKLMIWMEVMYKLASGVSTEGINADTLIRDTKLDALLAASSGGEAVPSRGESLRALLAPNDSYKHIDTRRRALGSLFHVIQDSYAVGHVRRVPLNPGDRIQENPLKYKSGVADRWGEILNFHTYRGQNGDDHKLYDHTNASVPNKNNLHDVDQWNSLIGCRDGVDKCSQLAQMCFEGRKWEGPGGVEGFLSEEVFAVSTAATPSDNTVL